MVSNVDVRRDARSDHGGPIALSQSPSTSSDLLTPSSTHGSSVDTGDTASFSHSPHQRQRAPSTRPAAIPWVMEAIYDDDAAERPIKATVRRQGGGGGRLSDEGVAGSPKSTGASSVQSRARANSVGEIDRTERVAHRNSSGRRSSEFSQSSSESNDFSHKGSPDTTPRVRGPQPSKR